MANSRRRFLKLAGASLAGAGWGVPVASALAKGLGPSQQDAARPRYAMVIDTRKCLRREGCDACMSVCHAVHNVPAIKNPRHEVKWIWKEPYENAFPEQAHAFAPDGLRGKPVPVLCNHCESPPCVRVCPTQATWKRDLDGIVMMDMHRCIGCRYCMAACPYGARSFNWVDPRPQIAGMHDDFPSRMLGVVEKCNFCMHRLVENRLPACVEICRSKGGAALLFGDLNDPRSVVSQMLKHTHTIRRKPALGTGPNVFYVV